MADLQVLALEKQTPLIQMILSANTERNEVASTMSPLCDPLHQLMSHKQLDEAQRLLILKTVQKKNLAIPCNTLSAEFHDLVL